MSHKKSPLIIAEIGCNHKGDLSIAKDMIQTAAQFCHADAAKFQKRTPKELLTKEEYNSPHPNPTNSYGDTYGSHREFLEFTPAQHQELKEHCEKLGITYSTSVWDLTAAKEIVELNPEFIKVPSACNRNKPLIEFLCHEYSGEIHISLGMTTREEIDQIVTLCEKANRAKDTIIYSCTSGYPVGFSDICLHEINMLKQKYGHKVKGIGFSGHHLGIAADVAAMTLGAEYIERHFTQDRTWKGTDHAASLEPYGLRRLVRDVKNVADALSEKEQEILPIEKDTWSKLKQNQLDWI